MVVICELVVPLAISMGHYTIISINWQNWIRLYISICHLMQLYLLTNKLSVWQSQDLYTFIIVFPLSMFMQRRMLQWLFVFFFKLVLLMIGVGSCKYGAFFAKKNEICSCNSLSKATIDVQSKLFEPVLYRLKLSWTQI